MNRIYRLVFNTSLDLIQVASELGSSGGKGRDRRKSDKTRKTLPGKTPIATAIALSFGLMAPLLWTAPAQAATVISSNVTGNHGYAGGNAATGATNDPPGTGGLGTSTVYPNAGGVGASDGSTPAGPGGPGGHGYGAGGQGGAWGSCNPSVIFYYGGGGGGGGGAPGYPVTGAGSIVLNSGISVTGGAGGAGGAGFICAAPYGAAGGDGGSGGAGLYGSNFTLTNNGGIYGGAGGAGGAGGGGGPTGNSGKYSTAGIGGVGLVSTGYATVSNYGTIAGGMGITQADAVDFSGGGNTLALYSGSTLTGNVISTSGTTNGGDTLELGGTTDSTLSGTFAGSDPGSYSTAPVFAGFQTLVKTGASNWTVTNGSAGNAIPNWDVEAGTLTLNSATNDTFSASSTVPSTLSFGIDPTGTTSTAAGVDNGTIVDPGTATFSGEALTINLAPGTYTDGVVYTLMTASSFTDAAPTSVTFNPSLPSGMSCTYVATGTALTLTCTGSSSTSSTGSTIGIASASSGGGAFGFLSLVGLLGLAGMGARNRKARTSH